MDTETLQVLSDLYSKYTHEKYLNRTEILLRHKNLRGAIEFVWDFFKAKRQEEGRDVKLADQYENPFWFMIPEEVKIKIGQIRELATIRLEELMTKEIYKETLRENMLIDEAFYSSVIEGAFSTKKRTKELVKTQRPKDKSEQMILNNYKALVFVVENLEKPLDEQIFLQLHKIITDKTLEQDEITDRYRTDMVYVYETNGGSEPAYTPPKADEVQPMMDSLFQFINDETDGIDPIIKSHIIHFYIGYVHPFFDGNGRVARAFSYMYLLKMGYEFFRFFSLSTIINKHRGRYYKSFKDTEEYENDLTYFIATHTEITYESIREVATELYKVLSYDLIKRKLEEEGIYLSPRQDKFLKYICKKDNNITTINEYKTRMKVAYETARRSLNELEELGVFRKVRKGKKYIFVFVGIQEYLATAKEV